MDESTTQTGAAPLRSRALCLDFTNTVDWRTRTQPDESLNQPGDLATWAQENGLLTEAETADLRAALDAQPGAAAAWLAQTLALREVIYRVFAAIATEAAPPADDLAAFNTALGAALAHTRIVPASGGYAWGWEPAPDTWDSILWPVLRSAADLLTSPTLARVHVCAAVDCGWLFVDSSRNGSRRWCAMDGCGNRAKARRHYQRRAHKA